MDFLKGKTSSQGQTQPTGSGGGGGGGGGLTGKLNNAFGGGQSGEQKEDYLDKGVDYAQEHFLGQGPQTNESAMEQAKDEQISDAIRRGFKSGTGREFPVADKS